MNKLANLNVAVMYEVTVPSTQEKLKYRAYNVKEERALLTADQSNDGTMMISVLNQVAMNCLTPTPESLTSFDLEYVFAQIRSKSVGEISQIRVGCDSVGCEDVSIEYKYDLSDLAVIFPESSKKSTIHLSDTLAVKLKYPSVEDSIRIEQLKTDSEKRYESIKCSIEYIYAGEEVIKVSDEPHGSIISFVDGLEPKQYRKMEEFFDEIPFIQGKLKYRCTKCKKEHNKTIEGLVNFF